MVIYNTTQDNGERAKEIEVQVAEGRGEASFPRELRSLGKFTCKPTDERQESRVPPTKAHYVKVLIHSNYGHPRQTGLGEIELYGPNAPDGLFGLRHHVTGRWGDTVALAAPKHWIATWRQTGDPNHWDGWTSSGYFTGWEKDGWKLVYADKSDPKTRAVTLCRSIGKGYLVLDAQGTSAPPAATPR